MANGKVLEALVSIAGQVDPSLQKSLKQASGQFSGVKKAAKVTGAVATAGLATTATASVAVTKALYDMGTEFQEAKNTIRVGTGATGEALDSLYTDMQEVYKSIPTTMDDASTVIADYNTRLGLTGEPLQEISKQAIEVCDLLEEDLSTTVESSSKAFQQWDIAEENMSGAMDYIFKVSQSTGAGFNDLMGDMQSYGAQLQEMGFGFNEAAALIGQLDKAGVNSGEVLGAMKKSVTALAKEGISASDGLTQYYDSIMNAKDATEATSIASEIFGTRAASTMATAIRDGSLSVDDLTASLEGSDETILGAAEDTYTLADKFDMMKQRAQVALEPVASSLIDMANEAFPYVEQAMVNSLPVIKSLFQAASPIISLVTSLISTLLPPLVSIINFLIPIFTVVANIISTVLIAAIQALSSVINGIIGMVGSLADIFSTVFSGIVGVVSKPINAIIALVNSAINAINEISVDVPDWVPKIGGSHFGFNIPTIPTFATGGFTDGVSIAGEAGTEAIISFDPAYRSENLSYWAKAGQMLGATDSDLLSLVEDAGGYNGGTTQEVNLGGVTFAPNITIQGSATKEDVIEAIRDAEPEFFDLLEDFIKHRGDDSYEPAY